MTETVLFEGSQPASGGWNLALTIDTTNVNGTFDPSLISENGYFAVTYDGVQNGVYLALSDWEGGVWAQINVPSTCTQTDGLYTAVFSFEQCRMAYGSMDFAAADQICVGTSASTKTMVIHKVAWYGAAQTDSLGAAEALVSAAATPTARNERPLSRFPQPSAATCHPAPTRPAQPALRRVQRREIRCVSGTFQPFRRDAVGEGECLGDGGGVRRALRGVFR